jgi:hypothetical protein
MRLNAKSNTLIMAFFSDVDTLTVSTVALPSPHILLSLLFPQAVALHRSILEIAHLVLFSESQQAATVGFVVDEITEIGGPPRKRMKPCPILRCKLNPPS